MKKLALPLILFNCQGDTKHHIVKVPEKETTHVERNVETEITQFIEEQKRADPPGIGNIEIGQMKCDIRGGLSIGTGILCIYGLEVTDEDGKPHKKYYSCLYAREKVSCNPIELILDPRRRRTVSNRKIFSLSSRGGKNEKRSGF